MAKSTKTTKAATKTPAANSLKSSSGQSPSKDNSSKYQPSKDAVMDIQSLGATDGLTKLFEDSIKDIYWAENHLVKALPKMISAASSAALQGAISNHLDQTKTHVERLQQVFELLGKKPQAKKCDAMEGLSREGEGVIEDTDSGTPARDLGIIMASQKVEHYEISAYTGLGKLASKLGLSEVAGILSQTLAEEQEADGILAGIADNDIAVNDAQ
ncbi:MAG: ferritin-like domain-containing protein [Ferruginibacter sp.]